MSAHKGYAECTTADIVSLENEVDKLRAINAELLAALEKITHSLDPWAQSIAITAIEKAESE